MAFCLKLLEPSNTPRQNPLRGLDRQRHSGGKPSQTGHAHRRAHSAESRNNPVFPWSAERTSEVHTEIALYFARGELQHISGQRRLNANPKGVVHHFVGVG